MVGDVKMKREKGITILEVILAILMIGLASTMVIKVINLYNSQNGKYETDRAYYCEVIKAYHLLMVTNNIKTENKVFKYENNQYEVYVDDILVMWVKDNSICAIENNEQYEFELIYNFSCKIENNYLLLLFDGIKGKDSLFVRWIYE